MTMTKINGLASREGKYYLKRRVPKQYHGVEDREVIWLSLHTDSLSEAKEKAQEVWADFVAVWEARMAGRMRDAQQHLDAAKRVAKAKGIKYLPMPQVLHLPDHEIVGRIRSIGRLDGKPNTMEADALLGSLNDSMTVSQALEDFWELSKDKILKKSPDQFRNWRNQRIRAVKNFIKIAGDKPIDKITRDDMLEFRDWWSEKCRIESRSPETANADFKNFRGVLGTVNNLRKMGLDLPVHGLNLAVGKQKPRPQFSEEWVKTKLLAPGALDGLEKEARAIFLAIINTGARLCEVANLMPAHIVLDHKYPHIIITTEDREQPRQLKSANSERLIPLVGVSLDAMREYPQGFPRYHDSPNLSNAINRYLKVHGLKETKKHTACAIPLRSGLEKLESMTG